MIANYWNRFAGERTPAPRNDPKLFERVRCRVLKPFSVGGRRVEPDEVVDLQRHDALSMTALHRVEILA